MWLSCYPVTDRTSTSERDARIREIRRDEVAALLRAELPEWFGSIRTAMLEKFDERYAALAETAAAAVTAAVAAAKGRPSRGFSIGTSIIRSLPHPREFRTRLLL